MKCLTNQFQLCFFALATLNSYIYFCIGNKIGNLTDYLLHMLCLVFACGTYCNAVAEELFRHVTSVFKMRKCCDFECV